MKWKEPYDGGSAVTEYKLVIGSKSFNIKAPKSQMFVSGLKQGTTYEVKLYAKNLAGYGNASQIHFTTEKQGILFKQVCHSSININT